MTGDRARDMGDLSTAAAGQPLTDSFWLLINMVLYQVSGNVLGPRVMGRAVRLHPLIILVATMVGTALGGVVGLLLSVPAAAVLKVVRKFFYPRLAPRWGLAPAPDDHTQALSRDREAGSRPAGLGEGRR